MRVQARGFDGAVHALAVLVDAGVPAEPVGGNAIAIPDGTVLPEAVAAELAAVSDFAGGPPAAGDEGGAPATAEATHQPAEAEPAPSAPPKTGPGATRAAWADYAAQQSPPVTVTDGMSRDDIIRAVEAPSNDG